MSGQHDPLAGIDFSKPLKINPDDISGQEMDDFFDVTGGELWPFLTAIRNGEIKEDQLLLGKNRKAMYAMVWILFRRQKPDLSFEQVYRRGVGEIGLALTSIQQVEAQAATPVAQPSTPVASGWQQES